MTREEGYVSKEVILQDKRGGADPHTKYDIICEFTETCSGRMQWYLCKYLYTFKRSNSLL